MAKYRYLDKQETNGHGQILGYAEWMGGPDLTYVKGVILKDGTTATWFKTGDPDTYWTVPGFIHRKSKKVYGFLHSDCPDGSTEAQYLFTPYAKD